MRAFKFRVYSKPKNKYLPSYKNEGLVFGVNGCKTDEDFDEIGGWDLGSCIQDNYLVVQQFTGLKDSKGVDIYEGDIIKYTIKPNQLNFDIANKDFFADVVWHEYTLSFGCITKCKYTDLSEDTFCSFGDLIRHMESLEVIGNIFELPCKPDHNGECVVCDCWLSDCPLRI